MTVAKTAVPSRSSLSGLNWLNFFVANVQTGFGPFISVYLTTNAWPQVDIGLVLTISGAIALVGQFPSGIMVDAMRSKRLAAAIAIAAIAATALIFIIAPVFPLILLAEVFHGIASCFLGPAIAAITVGLVAERQISQQFARNVSFASIGNGLAAALMGVAGRIFSDRAVFVLTAALTVPALFALRAIRPGDIDPLRARGSTPSDRSNQPTMRLVDVIENRRLLIFSLCLLLFQLANADMLPLVGSVVTMRSGQWATVLIAADIVVPQIVVALVSFWVGKKAEQWGRKPLLLLGFAALPIRALLFALIRSPWLFVPIQLLDGVSAAVIGVLLPIVVADVTRRTGHFNAALGAVGTLSGIGASLSPTVGGYTIDLFGGSAAFLVLAAIAGLGAVMIWLAMPETRPAQDL